MKDILSVVGRPGLFRILSKGQNKLLVQSLEDGSKTFLFPGHQKIISLCDILVFTETGNKLLSEVFKDIYVCFEKKIIEYNPKDEKQIRELFAKAVPDYSKEKIHLSDMKKIFKWYNLLVKNNIDLEAEFNKLNENISNNNSNNNGLETEKNCVQ
ncbi:MAG: DUF5606 domain-containing protein [Bacteroidales bacterium]|nr:DUF5606 domain-containing protein [Bacteroidales bacterium]